MHSGSQVPSIYSTLFAYIPPYTTTNHTLYCTLLVGAVDEGKGNVMAKACDTIAWVEQMKQCSQSLKQAEWLKWLVLQIHMNEVVQCGHDFNWLTNNVTSYPGFPLYSHTQTHGARLPLRLLQDTGRCSCLQPLSPVSPQPWLVRSAISLALCQVMVAIAANTKSSSNTTPNGASMYFFILHEPAYIQCLILVSEDRVHLCTGLALHVLAITLSRSNTCSRHVASIHTDQCMHWPGFVLNSQ